MKSVAVTELRKRLSHYLRLVKKGETIRVMERSAPVAVIQGIGEGPAEGDARLERLIRQGIVTPPKLRLSPKEVLKGLPVRCRGDGVKVLREQRGRW